MTDGFTLDTDGDGYGDAAYADANSDGVSDTIVYDTNGDGLVDEMRTDADGDGTFETFVTDVDGDGRFETVATDTDHDGYAETVFADSDGDGRLDGKAVDTNHDGTTDQVSPVSAQQPGSGTVTPPETMVPMGGNSPLYDGYGNSMVPSPAPSGSSGTVVGGVAPPPAAGQDDPTHVTLGYVPEQVPHAAPPNDEATNPTTSAGWQHAEQMQEIEQGHQDVNTRNAGNIPGSDLIR